MVGKMSRRHAVGAWVLAALVSLALTLPSYAQCCSGGACPSPSPKSCSHGGGDGSDKPSTPEPYGGQLFCPVTGEKLGLRGPAVPVQTTIGEKKPSFMGKLFGKKPAPGALIYVCCPNCADKVQSHSNLYLTELIADKACFAFTYASAPAKRPYRLRMGGTEHSDIPPTQFSGDRASSPAAAEILRASTKASPSP